MVEMLEKILNSDNAFASGGLLVLILGSVGVFMRDIPMRLWHWLVAQSTMTITVTNDDMAYVWVKEWFLEQEFLKRFRRVDLNTKIRDEGISLLPAPGTHWFWLGHRPYRVDFERAEVEQKLHQRRCESFTFRTIGRDQKRLQAFVREVVVSHERNALVRSELWIYSGCWDRVIGYRPRLLESVQLGAGDKEALVADIERFLASRERYALLGVPYHRGYLFHGPPGTGKTSLAAALAHHFGLPIFTINLQQFDDASLAGAMHDVPARSVVLFEDIDCMSGVKRRADGTRSVGGNGHSAAAPVAPERVTLSGLLNALDGFSAPDSVIYVMTTNHVEALDPALLRPGRIDYRLYLGRPSEAQMVALYRRFFPERSVSEAVEFVRLHDASTMAEFQGVLLRQESDGGGSAAVPLPGGLRGNHERSAPKPLTLARRG
jgi:chaperone BCS1